MKNMIEKARLNRALKRAIKPKYVCYVFVHSHLSTMQKGIQAAHMVGSMVNHAFRKTPTEYTEVVKDWAAAHKTLVVLEGGNSKNLEALYNNLSSEGIAVEYFTEDVDTLNGMMAAIGFVVDRSKIPANANFSIEMAGLAR